MDNKENNAFIKVIDNIMKSPEENGYYRLCNICNSRFRIFDSFGKIRKREAICPGCKSLDRHRHLYIHILSIYPFLENKKILHFSPEKAIKDILLASPADYYDADIDPEKATYKEDITNTSFPDNFFDYIFCIHVLEHIPDDIKAMKEMFRILKPGGVAYLSVPLQKKFVEDLSITDPELREIMFGQKDHVRIYNLDTFRKRLKSCGFNVDNVSYPSNFPENIKEAFLLNDRIVLAKKI